MSFRRKTYPEVAESLLNRLLGGVSGEAPPYTPAKATREPYRHPLARPTEDRIRMRGVIHQLALREGFAEAPKLE